jgi:DNA-directed RNA polymerase subunit RPC12/RpoP
MRFVTDCVTCGRVVVPAGSITLVAHAGRTTRGTFPCPVCGHRCVVKVTPGTRSVLLARGAAVSDQASPHEPAPLTLADLAELRRLLADDDACRRLLTGQ